MTRPAQLLVVAKEPRAGRAKTRLCPPLTPAQAAEVAAAALADTLASVAAADVVRSVCVLDGAPGDWLPPGTEVLAQRGAGLDERLAAAFDDASRDCPLPMLLVGMDTPQITPELLTAGVDKLLEPDVDAVLGRALDGGWWALGLKRPGEALLCGVPMSTRHTGRVQLERLRTAGLRVQGLPVLRDVDTAADARAVAAQAPSGRFAAAVEAVGLGDGLGAAS